MRRQNSTGATISNGCVVLGLAALASSMSAPAQAAAACPDPITIGLTTVLTTDTALLGVQARNGVQYAIDEINEKSGFAGKKAKLIVEDTGTSGAGAINALNRVLEDKPLVVYSSMISPLVFAQSEIIKKAEVPFIVAATNAKVTSQGIPWLFRMHVHDGQLAEMIPTYVVNTLKKTKPAILVVADDFGLGAQKAMVETFTKLGVPPVALASYAPTDKDMSSQLLNIKDKGADVVLVFGRPADVTVILKTNKSLGLDLPVVGNASIVAQTALGNLTPDEANGSIAVGGMIPQTSAEASVKDFAAKVLAKFKVPADNYTPAYYDSVYMLKSVIDKVGCDKAAIRDGLAAIKDYKGLLINYTADAKGDLAHTAGIYKNNGRTPELTGKLSESGF
jgi:branched-chain amino acid transport system substrate-binding protein